MIINKDKKYILNEFLINISAISDIEYQKRVWIRCEGPECDDFTETVCYFFDDGDPILKKHKDYGITDKQYDLLIKFRNEFEAFSDKNNWPEDFINTPEWARIMEMAKEILKAFDYKP